METTQPFDAAHVEAAAEVHQTRMKVIISTLDGISIETEMAAGIPPATVVRPCFPIALGGQLTNLPTRFYDWTTCNPSGVPVYEERYIANHMEYTHDKITELKPNEIFVFGSNLSGRHGRGAALTARKFGAVPGQGTGKMGQSYGIATKDGELKVLPLPKVRQQITEFLHFAVDHPQYKFLVTQLGCGLAGWTPDDIAPLFFAHAIPSNVVLPKVFWEVKP
jgi:hypothetical protein